jgi:dTDP-4-dehydrorhamnose reductase
MLKNILLLGKNGQVGWELQRSLAPLGQLISMGRNACDLADPERLRAVIHEVDPTVIVNAGAYTAVDKAESESERALAINALAPGVLADEAKKRGAWLVQYSTDYVFDGNKASAYGEDDETGPLSVYGATKLAGEQAILQSGCRHLIFRTSWVFAARGGNFAKTMLRLAQTRDELKVVGDQFGAPTSAELIADISALCLRDVLRPGGDKLQGVYHLAAAGDTSWHGYAQYVLTRAAEAGVALQCSPERVIPIPTTDYPLPARRPANSRLATSKLQQAFDLSLPHWSYHAERMLTEILTTEHS